MYTQHEIFLNIILMIFDELNIFEDFKMVIYQIQTQQYKMWLLKKTAENVWNASKNLVDSRSPIEKLIDSIANSQEQILPTNKLNQLATMTYEMEAFDEILETMTKKLRVFHYDKDQAQKTLNLLITTNYLIKHGATGFVDEFREYIGVFKKYQTLKQVNVYEDEVTQKNLDYSLEKIKSRAHHITVLLEDKEKLLKQKELSMLVRQKLKLYEKSKLSELKGDSYSNQGSRDGSKKQQKRQSSFMDGENVSGRLEGLLERYVWKYVDKLDDTIENASQKIMEQIDKYVLGEEPGQFELEEAEKMEDDDFDKERKQQMKKQMQDEEDLMKKLQQESKDAKPVENQNLLDFEEVVNEETNKNKAPQIVDNLLD